MKEVTTFNAILISSIATALFFIFGEHSLAIVSFILTVFFFVRLCWLITMTSIDIAYFGDAGKAIVEKGDVINKYDDTFRFMKDYITYRKKLSKETMKTAGVMTFGFTHYPHKRLIVFGIYYKNKKLDNEVRKICDTQEEYECQVQAIKAMLSVEKETLDKNEHTLMMRSNGLVYNLEEVA